MRTNTRSNELVASHCSVATVSLHSITDNNTASTVHTVTPVQNTAVHSSVRHVLNSFIFQQMLSCISRQCPMPNALRHFL